MHRTLLLVSSLALAATLSAQGGPPGSGAGQSGRATSAPVAVSGAPQEVPLWPTAAPGALGDTDADKPTITIYRAARVNTGTGVIVAPGGSYTSLAMDHEGRQVAAYFNAM